MSLGGILPKVPSKLQWNLVSGSKHAPDKATPNRYWDDTQHCVLDMLTWGVSMWNEKNPFSSQFAAIVYSVRYGEVHTSAMKLCGLQALC